MYFRNYGLDKYLISAISQYPSTRSMVKSPKHLSNYDGATLIILIDDQ